MIGLLVISHHFKLPEVGNNEMILAVNAAIA